MGIRNKVNNAFRASFEDKCAKIMVRAYENTLMDRAISSDWDENDITAQLHEYIDVDPYRIESLIVSDVEHHLPKKGDVKEKGFAAKYPRIDLRFVTINSNKEFKYFFEAKNLKEKDSGLKRRYITTGIDNYNSKKYNNGCLVGYLLEGSVSLTVDGINKLLIKDQRNSEILNEKSINLDCNHYVSEHSNLLYLKHFIFNFSPIFSEN